MLEIAPGLPVGRGTPRSPAWRCVPVADVVSAGVVGSDNDEHVLKVGADVLGGERQRPRLLEDDGHNVVSYVPLPEKLVNGNTAREESVTGRLGSRVLPGPSQQSRPCLPTPSRPHSLREPWTPGPVTSLPAQSLLWLPLSRGRGQRAHMARGAPGNLPPLPPPVTSLTPPSTSPSIPCSSHTGLSLLLKDTRDIPPQGLRAGCSPAWSVSLRTPEFPFAPSGLAGVSPPTEALADCVLQALTPQHSTSAPVPVS